jgi:hypothetical protein
MDVSRLRTAGTEAIERLPDCKFLLLDENGSGSAGQIGKS